MKKEKDVYYYRNILHKDSIALLIVSIIFAIISFIFITKSGEEFVGIFLKSILFIIFSIILLLNKKELSTIAGKFSIITGIVMILTFIVDRSLFGLVYFLLGIFLIIHSISYLKRINKTPINTEIKPTNYILKYLCILPIILGVVAFVLSILKDFGVVGLSWLSVIVFLLNLVGIALCIIYSKKYIKSVLVYLALIVYIVLTAISMLFFINDIRNYMYVNSKGYIINTFKNLEEEMTADIVKAGNLKKFELDFDKENVVTLKSFVEKLSTNEILSKQLFHLEVLNEKDYICEGYITLSFKEDFDKNSYFEILNAEDSDIDNMKSFVSAKSYIKCDGKYSYTTEGYDANKLKVENVIRENKEN